MNVVMLLGTLSREQERRFLPSGDTVVSFDLTIRDEGTPTESVPVAWPDAPPAADALALGEEVVVIGRVRRRFFRAAGSTQSRTEVVAARVVPSRQATRARRALDRAMAGVAPTRPTADAATR